MDLKLTLTSAIAGLCIFVGAGTILKGYELLGLVVFLIGVGNLYGMLRMQGIEKYKALEFALKYPAFLVLIVGFYIGSGKSWNIESLVVFYSGLIMLGFGLMIRSKRIRG